VAFVSAFFTIESQKQRMKQIMAGGGRRGNIVRFSWLFLLQEREQQARELVKQEEKVLSDNAKWVANAIRYVQVLSFAFPTVFGLVSPLEHPA
jgi:hypothetical protein